ncbi:hypothetical protein BCR33DRAFT_10471 [Rhizoclosmatium globosum]|uniref:Uncharacterized protein n=1 Tax=Rhizoclosmatium globosum TaxID=329046 RepID=A0A1Y2D421_9FUNG|nr:hypothetical protein BCR33DRAFT_10471 [Rhizoclosmatium globosum]|eukprot:ORY53866.1 hypothetical protein BCR33DRAFT_10471 [Rhizoclosmatium globosum]
MADSELPQYEATQETVETEQTPFEKLLTALPEFGTLLTHYDQFRSFERDIQSNTAAVNELKYEIEVCDKTIETLRKEESSIYDQVEASAPPKSPSMAFGSFFSKGKQPDVNRKATTVHKVDPEHIHTSIEIQQQTKQHLVARLRKLQDVRNDLEAVENELFVFKLQLMRFLDNVFDNATLFDLDDPRFEDHASVMASLTDSHLFHHIDDSQNRKLATIL